MSAIFDYEEIRDFVQYELVCPSCGHNRFLPFDKKRRCIRVRCGLCSQDIMRPRITGDEYINCEDCALKAECLGLPIFKIYDFIIHG